MNTKDLRIINIIISVIAVVCFVVLFEKLADSIASLVGNIVATVILINFSNLRDIATSQFVPYDLPTVRIKKVRVSYSYLIRIKVDNKYLLVWGRKYDKYIPVGGSYHYLGSFIEDKYGFERDESHGDKKDVRGVIPYKNLNKFIRWTKTNKRVEVGAHREFIEEMIDTGYLPRDLFGNPEFSKVNRIYKGIAYSPHTKSQELLIFDIYNLITTPKQDKFLEKMTSTSASYVFASKEEIQSEGVNITNTVANISNHSYAILEGE